MGCNCGKKRIYYTAEDDYWAQEMRYYLADLLGPDWNLVRINKVHDFRGLISSTVYTHGMHYHRDGNEDVARIVAGKNVKFIAVELLD